MFYTGILRARRMPASATFHNGSTSCLAATPRRSSMRFFCVSWSNSCISWSNSCVSWSISCFSCISSFASFSSDVCQCSDICQYISRVGDSQQVLSSFSVFGARRVEATREMPSSYVFIHLSPARFLLYPPSRLLQNEWSDEEWWVIHKTEKIGRRPERCFQFTLMGGGTEERPSGLHNVNRGSLME